jgi:hypothetical protein
LPAHNTGPDCAQPIHSLPQVRQAASAPYLEAWLSIAFTLGIAGYWWLVFVPSERRDLAANKNKGGLNGYLDSLEASGEGNRGLEKWFYSEWIERRKNVRELLEKRAMAMSKSTGESYDVVMERLVEEDRANNIERSKNMPAFLSADNPVMIAFALSAFGVLVASGGPHK